MRIANILINATALALVGSLSAACAGPSGTAIPSLAKRSYELSDADIERLMAGNVEVTDPTPSEAADLPAELAREVDDAFAAHQSGQSAFQNAFPATERLVAAARGAASGSESWYSAQMAVSRLDSARAPSITAIGALDSLYIGAFDRLGVETALAIEDRRQLVAEDVAYQSRVSEVIEVSLR